MVFGSCQNASRSTTPPMLRTAAIAVVANPAAAPAANEPDRQAVQNPAASRIPAAKVVDTWERA